MRGEYAVRRHRFKRRVERQPLCQMLAQQLEDEERGVAFVEMPHGGLHSEGAQRARAADAEDHLLADPGGFVSTVQAVRDIPVRGRDLWALRVEDVDRAARGLCLP